MRPDQRAGLLRVVADERRRVRSGTTSSSNSSSAELAGAPRTGRAPARRASRRRRAGPVHRGVDVTPSPSASESAPYRRDLGAIARPGRTRCPSACRTVVEPMDGDRRLLHQVTGQRGNRVVVAVGLVGLDHRELRRVRGVRALVAEVPVDLEDLLDPADHAPLEEELRCDPQVQLDVVGVQWVTNGRAAAPPCSTCSIGVSTSRNPRGRGRTRGPRRPRRCGSARSRGRPVARSGRRSAGGPGTPRTSPGAAPAAGAAPWPPSPTRWPSPTAHPAGRRPPRPARTRGRRGPRPTSRRPAPSHRPRPARASPATGSRHPPAGWRSRACRCCGRAPLGRPPRPPGRCASPGCRSGKASRSSRSECVRGTTTG